MTISSSFIYYRQKQLSFNKKLINLTIYIHIYIYIYIYITACAPEFLKHWYAQEVFSE